MLKESSAAIEPRYPTSFSEARTHGAAAAFANFGMKGTGKLFFC
jgi:hypothetical protein